jgi:glycosidase
MNLTYPLWVNNSIFYQIFPERFCNGDPSNDPQWVLPWGGKPGLETFFGGDLRGILDRLPYLSDLGVNAIYLTPIFAARSNHKYDAMDYMQIDPAFGDLAIFKELVKSVHQGGMHIVLDAVFNHCGDGFWAFQDLLKHGEHSDYQQWFYPMHLPVQQTPSNYQTCGGTHYLPKLNTNHTDVRAYLYDAARYWLEETGIDGWRLDVPWKVPMDFWQEFRGVVKSSNPEAYLVAEAWRDPAPWVNAGTTDGVMNYPQRDFILDYCVYDRMDAEDFYYFTRRLLDQYGEAADCQINLVGSHDTARLLTLCNENKQRMALAIIATFTLPGAPMIYYGDEIGMVGENDPDCRGCMNWDTAVWDKEIRILYQQLILLRKQHAALQTGSLEPLLLFNGIFAFRRVNTPDELIVVLNPREACRQVEIPLPQSLDKVISLREVFSGRIFTCQAGKLIVDVLPQESAMIFIPVSNDS